MEEERRDGKKGGLMMQGTLDRSLVERSEKLVPLVFMCENVLHAVTQFIAVNDQVRPLEEKNTRDTFIYPISPSLLQIKQCSKTVWLRCDQNHPY